VETLQFGVHFPASWCLQLGHARPRVETLEAKQDPSGEKMLQLGHARPRVETSLEEIPVRRRDRLQLGHARPRVETHLRRCERRPLLFRFNWATRVRAWKPTSDDASAGRYYFASIGPRASARGNPFLGFVLFVSFEPLQLGHARPRVETRPACFNPAHLYAGFNWATRVRAWKPV